MELGISPTHILAAVEPVEDAVEAQSPEVLCLESPALCLEPEELQPVYKHRLGATRPCCPEHGRGMSCQPGW